MHAFCHVNGRAGDNSVARVFKSKMAASRGKSRGQQFRFSLPNESDLDVNDHVRCSTPLIFGSNETSSRAELVNQENDDVELEHQQTDDTSDRDARKRKLSTW